MTDPDIKAAIDLTYELKLDHINYDKQLIERAWINGETVYDVAREKGWPRWRLDQLIHSKYGLPTKPTRDLAKRQTMIDEAFKPFFDRLSEDFELIRERYESGIKYYSQFAVSKDKTPRSIQYLLKDKYGLPTGIDEEAIEKCKDIVHELTWQNNYLKEAQVKYDQEQTDIAAGVRPPPSGLS